jgi:hypothetical protein
MAVAVIITMWFVCLSVSMATHWAIYVPVLSSISTLLLQQSIPSACSEGSSSSSAVSEALMTGHHGGASTIDASSVPCNDVVLSKIYMTCYDMITASSSSD